MGAEMIIQAVGKQLSPLVDTWVQAIVSDDTNDGVSGVHDILKLDKAALILELGEPVSMAAHSVIHRILVKSWRSK